MRWQAEAPSNIALIKYMGKKDFTLNIPCNPSLSYTLDHLRSYVELELSHDSEDRWAPLSEASDFVYDITDAPQAQQRFLKHLHRLKAYFNIKEHFIVRSGNNFPSNCGLASSAASFAALTSCFAKAYTDLKHRPTAPSDTVLSRLSREASGSSCRSFFKPWALWTYKQSKAVQLPYTQLTHQTVVISEKSKSIGSSQAHRRVLTSDLFQGRMTRARRRLQSLITSLQNKDWYQAYIITWHEFWDMHMLFHTAETPFSYLEPGSIDVIKVIEQLWQSQHDGPLMTLDAGPNVHLLYRPDQDEIATKMYHYFNQQHRILMKESKNQ